MTRTKAETTAAVNRMLLLAALRADPIVKRSPHQQGVRIEKMRAELVEYGYSIVTTEWLNDVLREMPLAGREGSR